MLENENMSDLMKHFTNLLGKDNIPENLKEILNHNNTDKSTSSNASSLSPEMLANLVKMFQSSASERARKFSGSFHRTL